MAPKNSDSARSVEGVREYGRPRATPGDLKYWHRFDTGGHPDYATNDSLDLHVICCVWHEGLPLFRNHTAMKTDAFRQACVDYQRKNSAARARIARATNNELKAVLQTFNAYFSDPQNGGYQMLFKHLVWVLHHEEMRQRVLELLDESNFDEIRSIYRSAQEHNPHVHYLIEAATNSTIENLVNDMK